MHQVPLGIVIRTNLRIAYITFGLEVRLEEELTICYYGISR
jgi:hypothetical protein